jgi:hypothetical protein
MLAMFRARENGMASGGLLGLPLRRLAPTEANVVM